MLSALRTLLLCTIYGAVGTALARFLYKGYLMIEAGVRRSDMSPEELLRRHMQIDEYALWGLLGGAAVGVFLVLIQLLGWIGRRLREPKEEERPVHDPDAIIRAESARKADDYLASRGRD